MKVALRRVNKRNLNLIIFDFIIYTEITIQILSLRPEILIQNVAQLERFQLLSISTTLGCRKMSRALKIKHSVYRLTQIADEKAFWEVIRCPGASDINNCLTYNPQLNTSYA